MNKHYIRLNKNKDITKIFSDAFEQPEKSDICVNENGGRHFNQIDGKYIVNEDGLYIFKYDGKIVEKTKDEIYTKKVINDQEIQKIKSELQLIDSQISRPLENVILEQQKDGKNIYRTTLDIIENKQELRKQLEKLDG